jgi:hypothetical protein
MNSDLRRVIDAGDGVAGRARLLAVLPRHVLDYAVRSGQLVRVHPRVYADPAGFAKPCTRARAALTYAGRDAALSHLTALATWRLPGADPSGPVHVVVPWHKRLRATEGIVVHRRPHFAAEAPEVVRRNGLPICRVERCVVDSWPLLPRDTGGLA